MAKQMSLAPALIGIAVAGALTASVLAATINVEVIGGTPITYNCTNATVDVANATGSFGGCIVTTSGTTTSTSGTTTTTSTSGTTTTTSTSGTTTSTSGTTTSTSGTTTGDPGWGTGTWIPPGQPNTRVVDQQGTTPINYTYIPGCVNNSTDSLATCASKSSYTKTVLGVTTTVTLAQPNVVSVRYRSLNGVVDGQYFQIGNSQGASIGWPIEISLTENPGDFAPLNQACKLIARKLDSPRLVVGNQAGQCPVVTGVQYYLNVKVTGTTLCTGTACVFKISPEPSSMYN